ncbi:MAG: hypothetical protein ACJ72D_01620 [Marmoricola sp.]
MIKKALAVTSFGAGYVLGAKAGHERYEQIRALVLGIKNDPHVQDLAGEAAEFAKEHGAAVVDKVTPDHSPETEVPFPAWTFPAP